MTSPLRKLVLTIVVATALAFGVSMVIREWIAMADRLGAREAARRETWRDATVLRICHGSTVYRLHNGRIVTGGGYRVENPETVCEAP